MPKSQHNEIKKTKQYLMDFNYLDDGDGVEILNTLVFPTIEKAIKAYQSHSDLNDEDIKDVKVELLYKVALRVDLEHNLVLIDYDYDKNNLPKLFNAWKVWC